MASGCPPRGAGQLPRLPVLGRADVPDDEHARDGELNEILVDRISPQDTRSLKGFEGIASLKGIGFAHFAAFLSRSYRENDYLLGRLHAMDRLIDIVCDSAGPDATARIDVLALKKRAFTRVLDAEEKQLAQSHDLIADLRRCVDALGGRAG